MHCFSRPVRSAVENDHTRFWHGDHDQPPCSPLKLYKVADSSDSPSARGTAITAKSLRRSPTIVGSAGWQAAKAEHQENKRFQAVSQDRMTEFGRNDLKTQLDYVVGAQTHLKVEIGSEKVESLNNLSRLLEAKAKLIATGYTIMLFFVCRTRFFERSRYPLVRRAS